MDRVAPTRRPDEKAAGAQRWRKLLFMHWEVPVEALRPLVPASLGLDLWEGRAYVGVVPFAMEGVRPWWSPEALAFDFLETNVRTYVHHKDDQPGVYFLSLEAASRVAVEVARARWSLPYFYADMSMTQDGDLLHYKTTRAQDPSVGLEARYRLGPAMGPSAPGSLEHFFLERYLLYVERKRTLYRGQVHHAPYPAQQVEVLEVRETLSRAAGLPATEGPPALAHYAEGVDVEVFDLRPVTMEARTP